MASKTHATSSDVSPAKEEDIRPNNPLQSDFNADDTSSMDEDERYLVRNLGG